MSPLIATAMDVVGALLMLAGALFTFIAAVGLIRLPDLFSRVHAAAKPQLLGLMLVLAGVAMTMRSWVWVSLCLVVLAIQMLAAPVASHMLARAAYRNGLAKTSNLVVDELEPTDVT